MNQDPVRAVDLTAELEFASKVAQEAATIVNTFYVGSSEVRYKSDRSPVTEADRSANQHIVTRVRAMFPDDGVLSEESKDDLVRLEKERVWIIDPLDGTKEFIARNGEFSIMIGLAVRGEAVMGVIMQPETGLLYATPAGSAPPRRRGEHSASGERDRPHNRSDDLGKQPQPQAADHGQDAQHDAHYQRARERSVGLKVGLIARHWRTLYLHPSPGK